MINKLAQEIYNNACNKGFYDNGAAQNIGERLCLIHSEVSEALEAHRKGKHTTTSIKTVNGWTSNDDFVAHFKDQVKDTFEDELADTIIRCLDTAAYLKIDIESHIKAKMRYNSTREYKHGKKY